MQRIVNVLSRYHTHDGWALFDSNEQPLLWTFCTTRRELRTLLQGHQLDLLAKYKMRKARIRVVAV
jgi:hypothetical protein